MKKILFLLIFSLSLSDPNPLNADSDTRETDRWSEIGGEISKFLSLYLSINTTNPPGNEDKACLFLKSILLRNGMDSQVIESPNGAYNLVSAIKGDGSGKPFLLLNQTDVSPAPENDWDLPPFAGKTKDGFMYGRGALDMKGMALMELFAFIEAKRSGISLKRDLIFLATSDGQTDHGSAGWIAREGILKNKPEYVLGGGSFAVSGVLGNDVPTYLVAYREKTVFETEIDIALPHNENFEGQTRLLSRISGVLSSVKESAEPLKLDENDVQFLSSVSSKDNFLRRFILKNLDCPVFWPRFKHIVLDDPLISDSIGTSLKISKMEFKDSGGLRSLVIFAKVSVEENGLENFFKRLKQGLSALGMENVNFRIKSKINPSQSPIDTTFYKALKESITSINRRASLAPYSLPYRTDLGYFRESGSIAYGMIPVVLPREVYFSSNRANERIPVKELGIGSRIIFETITRINE